MRSANFFVPSHPVKKLLGYMAAFVLLTVVGCGQSYPPSLQAADSLMNDRPDSALALLDGMEADMASAAKSVRMRYQLLRHKAMNKADIPFTSDSLMLDVVDYYDSHGTANDRMLAYYLLGRIYADTGEAPQAIGCYQSAIDAADTASVECDYWRLAVVYGQMANLLYHQNLYRDDIKCLNYAARYSYMAGDTLTALFAYAQMIDAYTMLQKRDSALIISEKVSSLFRRLDCRQEAAAVLALPVRYLIDQGEMTKAWRYMEIYEKESGLFDSNHQIESGREVYYYTKGYYFLAACQYDSAEFYFRKEMKLGHDFNNQNAGAYGLAQLFLQTHHPDSAAKYALYSYAMNDSAYDHESTAEVSKREALYNYSRYQAQAYRENQRAYYNKVLLFAATGLLVVLLMITFFLNHLYRLQIKKRKEKEQLCNSLKSELAAQQIELEELQKEHDRAEDQQQESVALLNGFIEKKQTEITELTAKVNYLEQIGNTAKVAVKTEESLLLDNSKYQNLIQKTNSGKVLSSSDLMDAETLVKELLPEFYDFLQAKRFLLNDSEYFICILRRLHIRPRSIGFAVKKDPSDITHYRQALLVKLFGINGSSKDFDKLIWNIGEIV